MGTRKIGNLDSANLLLRSRKGLVTLSWHIIKLSTCAMRGQPQGEDEDHEGEED